MSNVQNPTYFLAPNWTFPPDGKIAIGNIVRNPLKPHLPLTKADSNKSLGITISTETNFRLSLETKDTKQLSVWGAFIEKISLKNITNRERVKNGQFSIISLDTMYLSEDPTAEEIKSRCNHPMVREYMRLDSILCSPVYMVTGVKVAKGFKFEGQAGVSDGLEYTIRAEVAPEISAGVGAGGLRQRRVGTGFEADGDIIFAYQVMKIKPKGWTKEKKFRTMEYQHYQAFLAAEEKKHKEVEGETEQIGSEDLQELPGAQIVEADGLSIVFESPKHVAI
ncbi:hypothetical protein BKA56DRAFT_593102 [Ilyonectria sp. MPI-CAGE-AT-0026]|nr:hypothetical protein BKA56DRAFT_593102 [Ilyonectria sp. MPI-CAGE-AT-0026]